MTVLSECAAQDILDGYVCPLDGSDLEEMGTYDGDAGGVYWRAWFECRQDRHFWRAADNGLRGSYPTADEAADRYPERIRP